MPSGSWRELPAPPSHTMTADPWHQAKRWAARAPCGSSVCNLLKPMRMYLRVTGSYCAGKAAFALPGSRTEAVGRGAPEQHDPSTKLRDPSATWIPTRAWSKRADVCAASTSCRTG
jgi:hypothetical protein